MARILLVIEFLLSTFVLACGLFLIYRARLSPEATTVLVGGVFVTGMGMLHVFHIVLRLAAAGWGARRGH